MSNDESSKKKPESIKDPDKKENDITYNGMIRNARPRKDPEEEE